MESTTLKDIFERRSIRAYTDQPLSCEQIALLEKAALASPSAVNRQPWHFTFVTNQALLSEVNAACARMGQKAGNASPRFADPAFNVFYHAPCVVFISTAGDWGPGIDCGIACQNIVLAAQGLGLGSVILGLPRLAFEETPGLLEGKLLFPEGFKFAIAISIGYAAASKEAHPIGENKVTHVR